MTKAAIYLRVSSNEQNTANQLPALEEYARRWEYEVSKVYRENETAWRAGHQAELARLTEDAYKGKFKVLLVWSLDRLTREGPAAILNLVERFKSYGVKVLSLQESWTEAPGELGDLLYAIVGWVARMESQRRSERTKAALERLKAQGKPLGRPINAKDTKKRRRSGYFKRYAK